MKTNALVAVIAAFLVSLPAGALTLKELSPEARKIVQVDEDITVVRLDSGEEFEGKLLASADDKVSIRVVRNGISQTYEFAKTNVTAVTGKDISPLFAKAVMEIRIEQYRKMTKDDFKRGILLFDEFLEKCPGMPDAKEITSRRKDFKSELDALETGVVRIDGQSYSQLQASLMKCREDGDRIKILREQNSGIGTPGFSGSEEVRKEFAEIDLRMKNYIAGLPAMLMRTVPLELEKASFKDASDNIEKFMKVWFEIVIPEEARRRNVDEKSFLKDTDMSFLWDIQKRFMREYLKQNRGSSEAPKNLVPPKDMLYVPGGYFLMGRDGSRPGDNDFPMRLVYLEPFLMDLFEVRNKDYNEFVEYVKKTGDTSFEYPQAAFYRDHKAKCADNPALNGNNQPVVGVDWYDAYAYAKWKKKRLPTEAEWEKAARGMRLWTYSWGMESPARVAANTISGRGFLAAEMSRQVPPVPPGKTFFQCIGISKAPPPPSRSLPSETWSVEGILPQQAEDLRKDGFKSTDLKKDYSAYLLFHMGGNAAEWVNDWYDPAYYLKSPMFGPSGPDTGQAHVFRGGSYLSSDDTILSTWRGFMDDEDKKKGCGKDGQPMIGFRCAKSIQQKGGKR